jgi:hypothetical protein
MPQDNSQVNAKETKASATPAIVHRLFQIAPENEASTEITKQDGANARR